MSYIKENLNQEIFVGLIGRIQGQGKSEIVFRVDRGVPFANIAPDSAHYVQITENWLEIIREYFRFHYSSSKKAFRILGILHTHPSSVPDLSLEDRQFGAELIRETGNAILVVIGKRNVMNAYLVSKKKIKRIIHKSKSFRKEFKRLSK